MPRWYNMLQPSKRNYLSPYYCSCDQAARPVLCLPIDRIRKELGDDFGRAFQRNCVVGSLSLSHDALRVAQSTRSSNSEQSERLQSNGASDVPRLSPLDSLSSNAPRLEQGSLALEFRPIRTSNITELSSHSGLLLPFLFLLLGT